MQGYKDAVPSLELEKQSDPCVMSVHSSETGSIARSGYRERSDCLPSGLLAPHPSLSSVTRSSSDQRTIHDTYGTAEQLENGAFSKLENGPGSQSVSDVELPNKAVPLTGIASTRVLAGTSDLSPTRLSDSSNHWSRFRSAHKEVLAEFLATTILICIGQASALQSNLDPDGSNTLASLSYGIGVMLSIYVAGGISDAHLNPAVTVALAVFRGFPKWRILGYVVAQVLGAFAGCSIAYGVYSALGPTASQLVTAPTTSSYVCAFFNEFVASAIFMAGLLAISDKSNCPPIADTDPFIVALIIAVLGFSFGYPTGLSLNPIRDLAPRVVAAYLMSSGEVFTMHHYWFLWGGILSPILGCLFGSLVYDLFVFTGSESPVNWRHGDGSRILEDEQLPV